MLAADCSRVARANVHLVPDPNVATTETGTRHRTAEKNVGRQIDVPVINVSEDMSVVTIHRRGQKHARADPAGAGPRRSGAADPRSLQDPLSARSAARCRRSRWRTSSPSATSPCCSAEMVRRVSEEIEGYVVGSVPAAAS